MKFKITVTDIGHFKLETVGDITQKEGERVFNLIALEMERLNFKKVREGMLGFGVGFVIKYETSELVCDELVTEFTCQDDSLAIQMKAFLEANLTLKA